VAFPLPWPVVPRRFCSAVEDTAPFDPAGVWLPLAVEAVSATLRFLPFGAPLVVLAVPLAIDGDDDDVAVDAWC
jgi:hypothetical protein